MKMTLRSCTKCGVSKTDSDFYIKKSGSAMRQCKDCTKKSTMLRYAETSEEKKSAMRDYYSSNKEKIQSNRKALRESSLEAKLKHMIRNAKQRAELKGFEFDLTYEGVLNIYNNQKGKCFYLGSDLELTGPSRVSLDRQDPERGYTLDNVNLVCLDVNYMKRDISHGKFIEFCKSVGGRF